MFLVTPPNTNIEPDWSKFENIVSILYRENKVREMNSIFLYHYYICRGRNDRVNAHRNIKYIYVCTYMCM